ncbi:unnamed protein product [Vicia faba]|uniref:Calcineurin-like phosphoesterase domain-containing protein n=1 Tax=Vicia faba TaxID=3906 RepID=A0AAV1AC31_VICFA|nr:unnamed protein product [Vicia faba]
MKQKELTFLLCLIWALTLLYGEMFAYWLPSIFTCSWPHFKVQTKNDSYQNDYVKVAVITDPQLMDTTSLRLPEKSLALELVKFYTDLNMRRSFFSSILPFNPDVILFLGDYFDGGPYLSDEEWNESFNRFKHIFGLNEQGKYKDKQVYFISGNHDIGYESLHYAKPKVIGRYEEKFGIRNYKFTVGKVDFIAVDAQMLDGHPQKHLTSQVWEFVKNISVDNVIRPRVLLTHIPLYRPDGTYCGPDRSSPIINQAINRAAYDKSGDIIYQNYVSEKSSKYLLDTIKPKLILSGHDHDQCTITHQSKSGSVKEHTLGTISWQQGNWYPSFMLLSVDNSTLRNTSIPEEPLLTHLCYLPKQLHIYMWYIVLFGFTLLALLFWPTSSTSFWHQCWNLAGRFKQLIASIVSRNETKEKDEDANYEYEMMWDAEGSMHLIKKPLKASASNSNERSLGERGNVIMRPTARKNTGQGDFSMNMDMASSAGLDPLAKMPQRTGKSRTTITIQRLLRTLRMLTVIAAVNVPLYMMLLFKDWIEK